MTSFELLRLIAHDHPVACLVTDASPQPGPHIVYANPAFTRMSGYQAFELEGRSPRILQGKATEPLAARRLRDGISAARRARTVITNYRKDGQPYLCEIAVHPIWSEQNRLVNFFAFERAVMRRRGRPSSDAGRYAIIDTAQEGFRTLFDIA